MPRNWKQMTEEELWFYWLMDFLHKAREQVAEKRMMMDGQNKRDQYQIDRRNRPMYGPAHPSYEQWSKR